jgi:preprotein translocase subunit SecE
VARNRKRAKDRRARRPEPVGSRRAERQEPPVPLGQAAPDAELAEAQLAVGRPELPRDAGAGADDGVEGPQDGFGDLGDGEATEPELEAPSESGGPALPAQRERRPNPGTRVIHFAQGSWRELQRVQWPDRRQVMQATGVVIGFVIVAGLYLGLADLVATKVMNLILK